ncbi:MAG: aminotransferase class IV [Gemmatimonadota bacterium]
MSTVYLNGDLLPADEARISPDDRGFLFADAVYEVTSAYRGRPFRIEWHMERMARGLAALRIDFAVDGLPAIHERLLAANDLEDEEMATVYIQVTRGAAPRSHGFPPSDTTPTVYAFARRHRRPPMERILEGIGAITVPDRRWARVDVKTVQLLPNVLSYQTALEGGADDAILVRDGVALEGAASNLFFVFDGTVVTHPATSRILPGITRHVVLELAKSLEIPVALRAVQVEEIRAADEVFFTSTTSEVRPCVDVDGRSVGDGRAGPVARKLLEAFRRETGG